MSEEIEVLNDELDQICSQVEGQLSTLGKKTKMSRKQKEEICEQLIERMARARDVYSTYRVELREVLKEKGKLEYGTWEKKGHQHHKRIQALNKDVESQRKRVDAEPMGPGDFVKKDKNTWQAQELIDEGKRVQQKSHDSLARSNKLIASAEAMGAETSVALKAQTEQMRSTNHDISEVDAGIRRANTVIRQIGRRIATDKMIVCLLLVVILAILAVIVLKAANLMPGDGDGEVINCALDFTKATKKCMEEEAAAAAHKSEAAPASPPSSPTASPPAVSPAARRNGGARQAVLGERRAGVQGAAGLAHVKLKRLKRLELPARANGGELGT